MGGEIISESGGGIIPLQGGGIIPELGGGFLRNQQQLLRQLRLCRDSPFALSSNDRTFSHASYRSQQEISAWDGGVSR
jgi:hypothetical protein